MWKIVQLVMAVLEGDLEKTILTKLIQKYGNQKLLNFLAKSKKIKDIAKSIATYGDPEMLLKLLARAPRYEVEKVLQQVNKKIKDKIMEQYKKTDKNQENKDLKDLYSSDNKWVNLSSSWIKKGMFHVTHKDQLIGNLTILIRPDNSAKWYGPYTYPNVPKEIWIAMKSAKGKNGTGAGKTFWVMWLRRWLPSALRKYVRKNLAKEGIIKGKQSDRATRFDAREIKEAKLLIRKYHGNYNRTKKYNRFSNYKDIDTRSFSIQNRIYANSIRQAINQNNTKTYTRVIDNSYTKVSFVEKNKRIQVGKEGPLYAPLNAFKKAKSNVNRKIREVTGKQTVKKAKSTLKKSIRKVLKKR